MLTSAVKFFYNPSDAVAFVFKIRYKDQVENFHHGGAKWFVTFQEIVG